MHAGRIWTSMWLDRAFPAAGDVNGDGIGDLIVGAATRPTMAAIDAGEAYVIYGVAGTGRGHRGPDRP
jgi:hypothetical protein